MSDVAPESGRSKRRKSRLGKKEYPVGKPVAPPPGWVSNPSPPIAPPPPAAPLATWVPPPAESIPDTPLPAAPLTNWTPPVADLAPAIEPPLAEPAMLPPTLDPTGRPMLLSPNSAPIWTPPAREADVSPEMTYDLEAPAPLAPTSYTTEPLLTPSAKIGLVLVGLVFLVGAGVFVFHGKPNAGGESLLAGNLESEPRGTPATVVPPPTRRLPDPGNDKKEPVDKEPQPTPTPEKNPEPTPPEKNPEPRTPEPKTPDKPLATRPPPEPPISARPLQTTPIFEKDVFPIFQAKCVVCHGGRKKGGVDVRSVDALVGKGEEDGVLVRGSITKSKLWRAIDTGRMPKAGEKITAEEKELIRRWIMAGAKSTPKSPPPALPGGS